MDIRLKLQVHLIADVEGTFGAALVGVELHMLLSSEQVLMHQSNHRGTFGQHRFNIRYRRSFRRSKAEMARGMAIQYLNGNRLREEWRLVLYQY